MTTRIAFTTRRSTNWKSPTPGGTLNSEKRIKSNAIYTTILRAEQIEREKPEIIIINSAVTGSRLWKQAGTSMAERKFVRDERYPDRPSFEAIVDELTSPASGYAVKFETEQFVVFERKR